MSLEQKVLEATVGELLVLLPPEGILRVDSLPNPTILSDWNKSIAQNNTEVLGKLLGLYTQQPPAKPSG